MAHYASDCWDADVETSYGWVEVAGHADRTCYDLGNHTMKSGVELVAARPLKEPITKHIVRVASNKGNIYKAFKDKAKAIFEKIESLSESDKENLIKIFEENKGEFVSITVEGEEVKLPKEMMTFERQEIQQVEEKFIPGVIEPSFGIGRITYCVMEHCFGIREKDERRTLFSFPPVVAPYKVSVLPLIHSDKLLQFVEPIRKILVSNGISYKIDDISDSIGRRYARTDEIGIPFGITIDDDTAADHTVTLREILTMKQIRIPIDDVGVVIRSVVNQLESWENVVKRYPAFEHKITEK